MGLVPAAGCSSSRRTPLRAAAAAATAAADAGFMPTLSKAGLVTEAGGLRIAE